MSTLVAISGLGIVCLLLEVLNLRKILVPVALIALIGILGMTFTEFYLGESCIKIDSYNMILSTGYSQLFSMLFIVLTIFILLMSPRFYKEKSYKIADYVALKIFLLAGAVAMVSFGNLAMLFLGVEVLSIVAYVLASSETHNLRSNEAGMKYFLMGAFASSFILFGIALIYGAVGSFAVFDITSLVFSKALPPIWFYIGSAMLIVGLLFKASIVPFHFWAPDVYEGSPSLVTALMSTLVKAAAIGSLFIVATMINLSSRPSYVALISILAVLTMFVGNITALRQTNIKRLMAYSGISHAGFMLMTLLTTTGDSANTLLYYAIAYSLAGIAAFAVIIAVCQGKGNEDLSNFQGLAKRQPVLAGALTAALLSLAGIPVFAGFFAKLFLFADLLQSDHLILVIFGVVNSIISVYYYFKVINVMFVKSDDTRVEHPRIAIEYKFVAVAAIILNLLLGIFSSLIMDVKI